ncbi:MAG: OmpA family protein [Polyangiaceae bacterium]
MARSPRGRALGLVLVLAGATAAVMGCGDTNRPVPHYAEDESQADKDGDLVPDRDDACPADPEDGLPPKANDGCPYADPDEDGVAMGDDQCPDAKEDGEDPKPADGCPVGDTDGDGVSDSRDKCADKAEDNLLPDPGDGCPAPDADNDGLADTKDKCKTEAETMNGYRDNDGCPDKAPDGIAAYDPESAEIWVAPSSELLFEAGGTAPTAASAPTIDAIVKILKEHPELQRVEIEVHSTSVGDAKKNVTLTQGRADALASKLAAGGVARDRLVAIGYGEYCPAIDTGDESPDAKNERVVLRTVLVKGVWQTQARGCWRAKAAGIDPTKRGLKVNTQQGMQSPGI